MKPRDQTEMALTCADYLIVCVYICAQSGSSALSFSRWEPCGSYYVFLYCPLFEVSHPPRWVNEPDI